MLLHAIQWRHKIGNQTCVNGDICGANPPLRSNSANCSDDLSSYNVSPPNNDAIKTPSGFRLFKIARKHPGKLLTQCKLRLDSTKSKLFSSN